MMGPGPYRPARELQQAIARGELDIAIALSRELARRRGAPIPLEQALSLLPLVAARQADAYDGWALRWLRRWLEQSPQATIEQAAEIAGSLADLPQEPAGALDAIRRLV